MFNQMNQLLQSLIGGTKMKKLLLASVAISGLAFAAAPAYADIDLELGGYFKGYGVYVDQDETAGNNVNNFDIVRDTELHIGGETTLDNGLTVGAHFELKVDGEDGSAGTDESYAYFSGNWGRVNFGNEDGAGYLLQVAAPSADSNLDGIRQYVQPFKYSIMGTPTALNTLMTSGEGLDYDMDIATKTDKITYLSPIMNGFQLGLSYSPDTDAANDLEGVGVDGVASTYDETYEAAVRYEGQFQNVGVIAGAGVAQSQLGSNSNTATNPTDDRTAWNVGLDLDIGAFGLGAIYMEDDHGQTYVTATTTIDDEKTFVVGGDYTTGAFKLGASYMNVSNTANVQDLDTDRYTGGVVYTYGPGMTFRGSLSYVDHENAAGTNYNGTAVLLGTQVNF
jgi:predicted porin